MPENLGYQFNRLYPAPIETNRQVNTISDRNAIPMSIRWEGMFVHVISESTTFELVGGTDNTKWQVKEGLSDAPQDGDIYGRKDGQWEVISSGGGGEPYLVYIANLYCSGGTSANLSVSHVFENTLGISDPGITRQSNGNYTLTFSSNLSSNIEKIGVLGQKSYNQSIGLRVDTLSTINVYIDINYGSQTSLSSVRHLIYIFVTP